MNSIPRRPLLRTALVALTVGFAGCIATGTNPGSTPTPSPTPTPTPSPTPTPVDPDSLGTIEYTITNVDDVAHDVAVTMTSAAGQVVQETNEPAMAPGASVSSGSAGHPPADGPFELSFTADSTTERYTWDVRACGRVNLVVTVEGDGVRINEDLCQN